MEERKQKYERLAEIIKAQISKGDYSSSAMPSERVFAEKLGANRLTIRKALAVLEQEQVIARAKNGRYEIKVSAVSLRSNVRIALLVPPAFSSGNIRMWHDEIRACAEKNKSLFRPFLFVHWHDTSISEVLANFDGVFVVPSGEAIPTDILAQFKEKNGLVFLNTDMSYESILSINLYSGMFVRQLLDRFYQKGHRSIACVHVHYEESEVLNNRISQYEYWSTLNSNLAPIIKANIHAFNDGEAFLDAQIKKGKLQDATAVFCTTVHAAIALVRALKKNGLNPEGGGISICTIDDEGIGQRCTPSITCFQRPDIQRILRPIFNWIESGGGQSDWKGPLLVEPSRLKIYQGETLRAPNRL